MDQEVVAEPVQRDASPIAMVTCDADLDVDIGCVGDGNMHDVAGAVSPALQVSEPSISEIDSPSTTRRKFAAAAIGGWLTRHPKSTAAQVDDLLASAVRGLG